tara:strand:- start:1673 stop:1981 length:309 start_codon:yes stop_codon:yes gene_type:complete
VLILQKEDPLYSLFGILKLGRILRISKIIAFMNVEEDTKGAMNLVKIVFFLIVYIHFYACVWWLIVKNDKSWMWAGHMEDDAYHIYNLSWSSQYNLCLLTAV